MKAESMKSNRARQPGVTVITATNKAGCMKNLYDNFKRQLWAKKELVVILNNDNLNLNDYRLFFSGDNRVSVHRMPGSAPLGTCLNLAIQKANYGFIAKFDDDDYYAPLYLTEAMRAFRRTNADIVGKRRFFMYFKDSGKLLLAGKPSRRFIAGATIMFRKSLYPFVKFSRLRSGSDMRFLNDGLKRGCKLRSTSRYHYAAVRRSDQSQHTWKVTPRTLVNLNARLIARTPRFRRFVIPKT